MSIRGVENYELLSTQVGDDIVFVPPEGMKFENQPIDDQRSCEGYDTKDNKTDYIEYWKCGSYVFAALGNENISQLNSISSINEIIAARFDHDNFCLAHAYDYSDGGCSQHNIYDPGGSDVNDPIRERWSYITGTGAELTVHSNGYRDKDNTRSLDSWITAENANVLTSNCILSNWINALSTSLSTEIRARLQNHLYSNKQNDVNIKLNNLTPDQNFVDGNVVTKLRDAMNLLSTGVSNDNGANLQDSQSVIPNSKNIQTTTSTIAKTEVKNFIDDCATAYKDCICYSDCGGYAVCFCYGNCNYY